MVVFELATGLVAAWFRSIKKHLSRFQIDPGHASLNEICLAESTAQRSRFWCDSREIAGCPVFDDLVGNSIAD
jgi:hypothetical protein